MANYMIGSSDPPVHRDKGAGLWNSKPRTYDMIARKLAIMNYLPHAYVIVGDDAAVNLAHFFGNNGFDKTIDLEDMVDDVPSAKLLYERELALAKAYVETLPEGRYQITSASASGGYAKKSENWNWFYAVGGYSAWGKGVAVVTRNSDGTKAYDLQFEYRFFDRYNWDGGKSVTLFGVKITDQFMGEFHRQGLAQEFDMYGSMTRKVSWGATPAGKVAVPAGAGGR